MEMLFTIIALVVIGYLFFRFNRKSVKQLPFENFLDPETKAFVNNRKKLDQPYIAFIDTTRVAPKLLSSLREKYRDKSLNKLTEVYYSLMMQIQEAKRNHNYKKVSIYSQMSLGLIEPLIIQTKIAYGSFDIRSIPALEDPLSYYAINGYGSQIKNIEEIINFFPELMEWQEIVDNAKEMASMSVLLIKIINDNPAILQKDIKKLINVDDGKKVANVLYYMEIYGKIRKEKAGNSNKLFAV